MIYYLCSNKSTRKETCKTHLCTLVIWQQQQVWLWQKHFPKLIRNQIFSLVTKKIIMLCWKRNEMLLNILWFIKVLYNIFYFSKMFYNFFIFLKCCTTFFNFSKCCTTFFNFSKCCTTFFNVLKCRKTFELFLPHYENKFTKLE